MNLANKSNSGGAVSYSPPLRHFGVHRESVSHVHRDWELVLMNDKHLLHSGISAGYHSRCKCQLAINLKSMLQDHLASIMAALCVDNLAWLFIRFMFNYSQ